MSANTEEAECFSEDSLEVPFDKQKIKKKTKPKITVERKVKKTYLELYHKRNMKSVTTCTFINLKEFYVCSIICVMFPDEVKLNNENEVKKKKKILS